MEKNEIFPLEINSLENKNKNDTLNLEITEKNMSLTPESYLYKMTQEQMEGFININEYSYEKLRIFFSNYSLKVIENYYRYILGEKNISINNHIDAIEFYTLYQINNGISSQKTIKAILLSYGVDFSNIQNFEYSINRKMQNFRQNYVIGNELYKDYRGAIEEMAQKKYIPEELDFNTYREYIYVNQAFTPLDILDFCEKGIKPEFLRELKEVGVSDKDGILHIIKLGKEIGIDEIIFRLQTLANMFEDNVSGVVKAEIIKYPGSIELYSFLHNNPQKLKIGNKEIEFSHLKGPINVFRGILKLAENKCYNQFDEISLMYLIKEYEKSLNDFIDEGKNDYGKVFSLIQDDKAFSVSKNIENLFEKNYGDDYIKADKKYKTNYDFLNNLELYLQNNPTKKVLVYIAGHGGKNGVTQTNIGYLYGEDINRLKKLSINYNLDIDFDSCMSGAKIKGDEGIIRGSSLFENNSGSMVIKDLLNAYKGDINLTRNDIREIKNLVGREMYDSLKEKHFIGGIETEKILTDYYFNLNNDEKKAAKLILNYINKIKPKNGDYNGDGKVTWNEATLYKFLSSEYNIIPITYAKNINNLGEKREPISLS